jgi:cytochrome c oxidase subunit 3
MSEAPHTALDVSHLPAGAFDARSPLWWANLLTIFIETTTVALMLAAYFYLKRNFEQWPPPMVNAWPPVSDPVPALGAGTWQTILLVASCLPMYLTDRAARKLRRGHVIAGLAVMTLLSAASLWLRAKEFPAVRFSWDDNAYASIVWTILVLHLTYVLVGLLEFIVMLAWALLHGLDEKHGLDVTLAGGYWYWTAGIWVPVYLTIYWVPRWT